jgi:hypothetical protein
VVPSAPHCLTVKPKDVPPGIIIELRALPKTTAPTRAQVDTLLDSLADQADYSIRAWNLCGSGAK